MDGHRLPLLSSIQHGDFQMVQRYYDSYQGQARAFLIACPKPWADSDESGEAVIHFGDALSLRDASRIADRFECTMTVYNDTSICNWEFCFEDGSTVTLNLPLY
jgi:hypothetical protein